MKYKEIKFTEANFLSIVNKTRVGFITTAREEDVEILNYNLQSTHPIVAKITDWCTKEEYVSQYNFAGKSTPDSERGFQLTLMELDANSVNEFNILSVKCIDDKNYIVIVKDPVILQNAGYEIPHAYYVLNTSNMELLENHTIKDVIDIHSAPNKAREILFESLCHRSDKNSQFICSKAFGFDSRTINNMQAACRGNLTPGTGVIVYDNSRRYWKYDTFSHIIKLGEGGIRFACSSGEYELCEVYNNNNAHKLGKSEK